MRRLLLCLGISATVGGLAAAYGFTGPQVSYMAGFTFGWCCMTMLPSERTPRPDVLEA